MTVQIAALTGDSTHQPAEHRGELTSSARRVLVEGLSLGCLADFALRSAPGGLGWTLWIAALTLAAVNVARHSGLRLRGEHWAWLAVALGCALLFAWRDADALRAVNVLATLVALSMFGMAATGLPVASILHARLRDVVAGGLFTIRDLIAGAPMLVGRDARVGELSALRSGASWSAVRAVLLTLPIAFVFALLLSRADPVFASIFQLPTLDAERLVSHVVLTGAFAWWSAGWLRGGLLGVSWRAELPSQLPVRLGLAEVTTSLGTVILLFAVFVALQLRWLFAGAEVVLATTGLTVAEYARRGFFELVAVAALVLPLVLGSRAAIEERTVVRRHRQLSLVLLGLLAAIMASALLRMRLYVGYFGLSTDRLYATAIMLWLAAVTLGLVLTVLRGRPRPFAAIAVFTGFAALVTLNVLNPDRLITRINLGRPTEVREVDFAYLARLSGDATPAVVHALQVALPSPAACQGARALRTRWTPDRDTRWNLGARRGRAAVEQLTADDVQRLCGGG